MRSRKSSITAALLAFALPVAAFGGLPLHAESLTEGIRDIDDVSLEDLLRVPVTAAARHEQNVAEAPASASVITAEEIEAGGYETLAQVLRGLAGFYTSDDLNYTYVGLRGFSPPGDYNMRILVLLDGHPVNDVLWSSASVGTDGPIDLGLVDRIEVIRGPGSALYGTSAILGVVQIVTKSAARKPSPGAWAETGSNLRRAGGLTWGGPLGGGADLLVSASGLDRKGATFRFSEFQSTPSGGVTDNDGDRNGRLYGMLRAGAFRISGLRSSRTKHLPTGSWETIFDDAATRTVDTREYLEAAYTHSPRPELDLNVRAFLDRYISDGVWPYVVSEDSVSGNESRIVSRDETGVTWGGAEVRVGWRPCEIHRLTVGGEFHIDHGNMRNFDDGVAPEPDVVNMDVHRRTNFFSAYGQEEYAPARRILLTLGLHYDHYDTWGGTVTPRIALVAGPVSSTRMKLLYGKGFRAPSIGEVSYEDGLTQVPNPDLGPERIESTEAVLERTWASSLWTRLSAYRNEMSGLIQLVERDDGFVEYRDVGKVVVDGVEIEARGVIPGGLKARASASYQDARDEVTGLRGPNSPEWIGTLGVQASLLGRRFLAGLDGRYVGDRLGSDGWTAKGYATADANLVWRTPVGGLRVSLKVDNLADRTYSDPAGDEQALRTIPQYGRTWRLGIRFMPEYRDENEENHGVKNPRRPPKQRSERDPLALLSGEPAGR
jgi:iron complex outermembrane receptor protein